MGYWVEFRWLEVFRETWSRTGVRLGPCWVHAESDEVRRVLESPQTRQFMFLIGFV